MTTKIENSSDVYRWYYHELQENCAGTARPLTLMLSRTYASTKVKSSKYPDWKERIKRGEIATNNYSRSGYVFKHEPGNIFWTSSKQCGTSKTLSGYRIGTGDNSPPSFLDLPADNARVLAEATSRFAAEVLAVQQHLSGTVFAAELGKALKTIREPARGIENLLHSYLNNCSKLRRKYRRKVSKGILEADLYDLWLKQAFGWGPLIADSKAGAEAIARLIEGDRPTRQVRGHSSVKTSAITSPAIVTAAGGLYRGVSEFRDSTEVSCSIRGAVRAKASGPVWKAMDLFGFNANQFVPTVWELLPMSWVTDYFLNVGDILSATYVDFSGLYWDSQTSKKQTSRQYIEHSWGYSPLASSTFDCGGSGGSWTLTRKTMNRVRLSATVPSLVFSFPGHPNQVINLSAVLLKSRGISASLAGLIK